MEEKAASTARKGDDESNVCIALGAGVGVFGAASAVVTGAVCPLCIFVAPGLIGYGAFRKWKVVQQEKKEVNDGKTEL